MVNAIKPVSAFAAADGNRTRTDFTPQDFKSCASASSATAAHIKRNQIPKESGLFDDPDETRTHDLRRDRAAL